MWVSTIGGSGQFSHYLPIKAPPILVYFVNRYPKRSSLQILQLGRYPPLSDKADQLMRTKSTPDEMIEPSKARVATPHTERIKELADEILSEIGSADKDTLELAGRAALSYLLDQVSKGDLTEHQEFTFLKSLSERKTPDPIQRVEQHTRVDLRVLFKEAITENTSALTSLQSKAAEGRSEVRERLGVDDTLALTVEAVAESDVIDAPTEPLEVTELRGETSRLPAVEDSQQARNVGSTEDRRPEDDNVMVRKSSSPEGAQTLAEWANTSLGAGQVKDRTPK